jgi:tetratricopeptide (TPR) repeat protein
MGADILPIERGYGVYRLGVRFVFFLFVLCGCLPSNAQLPSYDMVFHKSYAERSLLFDTLIVPSLKQLPQAAFNKEIDKIVKQAKAEDDYAVELEAELCMREYNIDRELEHVDERIATMEKLLSGLDKKKYPEYAALIMFDLGNNYSGKKHNYSKGFENYINTYELVRKFSSKQFPDKKDIIVNIANRYYALGDYLKAKELLFSADSLPPSYVKVANYNNQNTLGLIYRNTGVLDSALHCFEKAYQLAQSDNDAVWAAIAKGNIGITYYMSKQYDKAIPLLKEDINGCILYGNRAYDNALHSLMVLAQIHLDMDSLSAAAEDITLAYKYLDETRDKVRRLAELYPVLALYHFKTGNLRKAYLLQDTTLIYKDSIEARDNIYKLAKVEYRKDIEKRQAELEHLLAEKRYIEFARNGLLGGVLLLFVIALLIINRQRLKHKIKQDHYLSEKKLAQQELSGFTQRLQEKNALIEKSAHEIQRLEASLSDTEKEQVDNEVLQQLYASTILTDEEWEEFKTMFEQVHSGFLQRLKNKMPGLSPADTRFLVLSKLKLSNKEMAGILGVQPETIRTYKYRLRKKYDLPEDDNITELVDAI